LLDSVVREFIENVISIFGIQYNESKFWHMEDVIKHPEVDHKLRITFQAPVDVMAYVGVGGDRPFDRAFYDHFNLAKPNTSAPYADVQGKMVNIETNQPDAVVMNNAAVFTGWKLSFSTHRKWVYEFKKYIGTAFLDQQQGRMRSNKKRRAIWYSSPFIHSPSHPGTEELTCARTIQMDDYSISIVRDLGYKIIDTRPATASRPEASYDGLHYLLHIAAHKLWFGDASCMLAHMALTILFSDCNP
jgi:hypothetical protein